MRKVVLILFLIIANAGFSINLEAPTAVFASIASFPLGKGTSEVMWNQDEKGGITPGPFQGPMAFGFDRDGDLLIGDTMNARILKVAKSGKLVKEFDLLQSAKQAGLKDLPVLLDFVTGNTNQLLVADASNNAILEIDTNTGKSRAFLSPYKEDEPFWKQINQIHTDGDGNIYVEDLASQKTVILNKDGEAVKQISGRTDIAVGSDSRVATAVYDKENLNRRSIYVAKKPGEEMKLLTWIDADNPIVWSYLLGFDQHNNLYMTYDTQAARHYVVFNPLGQQIKKLAVKLFSFGYDANKAHWIDNNGSFYSYRLQQPKLEILKLR